MNRRSSLAEQAAMELEHRLVTLQYAPGALLQEQVLAEDLQIGRTPVREAILKISRGGLLQVLPRKGLMVAPVSREELLQVLEARRVLERLMVVKAAERADDEQRQTLKSLADELSRVERDIDSYFRLDRQLDLLLASACGNPYLVNALAPLHAHCRRWWYLVSNRLDLDASAGLHVSLARSVANSDGSGAIRSVNGIISILESQLGALDVIS